MRDVEISSKKKQNKNILKLRKNIYSDINGNKLSKNNEKIRVKKRIEIGRENNENEKEKKNEKSENKFCNGGKNILLKDKLDIYIIKKEELMIDKNIQKYAKFDNSEENSSQEKDNKNNNYIRNNNKLNKNKIHSNKDSENEEQKNKIENKTHKEKKNFKLNENNSIEVKSLLNNIKIQRKEKIYQIKFNRIYIIYYYVIFLQIMLISQFIKCNKKNFELSYSYINLKIKANGYTNIFSESFSKINYPTTVTLNNMASYHDDKVKYKYNLGISQNNINIKNITLKWDIPPTSTDNMFSDCDNIIEIDLSNFDTSSVKSMQKMFYKCSSLISIDFSNLNTSGVKIMTDMFNGCSSLISLDLSNFITSNVTDIGSIFSGCSSLKYLNLSNFDLLLVENIDCIFNNCENLENINLKNVKINPLLTITETCSLYPPNLTICNENEIWLRMLNISENQYINCINNICSFTLNENEKIIKCYKNNIDLDEPCQICGNKYFQKSSTIINKIICDIKIEEEIDIKNITEFIQKMVNNLFIVLNITNIAQGNDNKISNKNLSVIMTSTRNQKIMKMKK